MLRQLEEFYSPETLMDALRKKAEYQGAAAPIAGGTDLVREAPPGIRCLIDITRLGLNYIEERSGNVHVGATTTMQEIATSPLLASVANGMLCTSTCEGWPRQIRNVATIGGNLVNAGPFADTPPALLALDATAVVADCEGEREIPLCEFFVDYRQTAVGNGILKEVVVPRQRGRRGAYLRYALNPIDIALVNAAVAVELVEGVCTHARIALGAMGRTCRRITEAEESLLHRPLSPENIAQAVDLVVEFVEPVLDYRASAESRREASGVLVRRALNQVAHPL